MLPAVHPHVAVGEWVGLIDDADAQKCPGDWNLCRACQLEQLALCASNQHAVSCKDDRALCTSDRLGEQFDLTWMPVELRLIPRKPSFDLCGRRVRRFGLAHQRIFGDVNVHWPRSPAARKVECLSDHVWNLIGAAHQIVVLRHWQGDAGDVDLLEGVLTDEGVWNVSCDHHKGHGVEHCGADAGDEVGGARSRGPKAHANVARGACVAIGGVRGGLLVTDQDVAQLWVVDEHVVERQDHAAWVAPDGVAPLQQDRLTECVGTNARTYAIASGHARIAQHVASRALCSARGRGSCAWYVPCLCHRSPFTTSSLRSVC